MEPLFLVLNLPFWAIRTLFVGPFERFARIPISYRPDFTSLSHSSPLFCGPFDVSLPIVGGMADLEATETIQIGTLADFLLIFPNLLL